MAQGSVADSGTQGVTARQQKGFQPATPAQTMEAHLRPNAVVVEQPRVLKGPALHLQLDAGGVLRNDGLDASCLCWEAGCQLHQRSDGILLAGC